MCGVSTSCLTVIATGVSYHCMRAMSNLCKGPLVRAGPRRRECRMRVALVGGAGEVGSEIARELVDMEEIETLLIADLDGARAAKLARELEPLHPGVVHCQLDVGDRDTALERLAGADVLMNCTSFRLFDSVLSLATEASIDYADLISEPEAQP